MNILVLGQGGREHTLIWTLSQNKAHHLFAIPGNPGMSELAECHSGDINDSGFILEFCKNKKIDLVVIGPEEPLVLGLADILRANSFSVVGPSKAAAALEGSKIFAKEFMLSAGIPTAHYAEIFSNSDLEDVCKDFSPPFVFKVDGLAAGKGVFICKDFEEFKNAHKLVFTEFVFGKNPRALIEAFVEGYELSVILLTEGSNYQLLPLAQDHKRLLDGGHGPNTGGMGTVAPIEIAPEILKSIEHQVIKPSLQEIQKRNYLFRGFLFIGVMMTPNGPQVLEYNCRLGDPETQVLLPLIENDLSQVLWDLSQGKLNQLKIKKDQFAACVVLASENYPLSKSKSQPIKTPQSLGPQQILIHSGTCIKDNELYSNGGRVLNCIGLGQTKKEALKKAYELANQIEFKGRQLRLDIGSFWPDSDN